MAKEFAKNLSRFSRRVSAHTKRISPLEKYSLILAAVLLTGSFIYSWYLDPSKPLGGVGWVDQDFYYSIADVLSHGQLPSAPQLHYPIGYPLLSLLFNIFQPINPFMFLSFSLLMLSAFFLYAGARKLMGPVYGFIFVAAIFMWDGVTRTFDYASELFAIPWNNQFLFFTMSFFLWLFIARVRGRPSWKLLTFMGVIVGVCFLTREESVLFTAPAVLGFLLITRANVQQWLVVGGVVALCAAPQFIVKYAVNGSLSTNRQFSYGQVGSQYFQPYLLKRNIWETLIDGKHYGTTLIEHENGDPLFRRGGYDVNRQTLTQSAPMLWLAPIGIAMVLFMRRYPIGVKVYFLVALLLLTFYLSGVNMSAHKLQFHALRYITPAYPMLYLAVIIVLKAGVNWLRGIQKKSRQTS